MFCLCCPLSDECPWRSSLESTALEKFAPSEAVHPVHALYSFEQEEI